ncbi:DUF4861 domain-containing protein [candidate division KSB1 bacterium]|nr:DUF4861 domain-containing protein [candidate division KSB1 bacterium]
MKKLIFLYLSLFLVLIIGGCQTGQKKVVVVAENELDISRAKETVVVKVADLGDAFQAVEQGQVSVKEEGNDRDLVIQLVDLNEDGMYEDLVFQADFAAHETKKFVIAKSAETVEADVKSKVYARFVPERKDDFAWENNRIAFRMYGPALQETGEISSGVDVWVKSVPDLVIDKWYEMEDYHVDHGEGLDYYKVGPSRGCGGVAIWEDGEMLPSKNFTDWTILANGPIRTVFELTYAPWQFDGKEVSEVKRITLDANTNMNKFESTFSSSEKVLTYAIGIVQREGDGFFKSDESAGWMCYWEPPHEEYGSVGCAVVADPAEVETITEAQGHFVTVASVRTGQPAIYYAGASWSKGQNFANAEQWRDYVRTFSRRVASPLVVNVQH